MRDEPNPTVQQVDALEAEVAALRSVLLLVAPISFNAAKLPVEQVEALGARYLEALDRVGAPGDQEVVDQFKAVRGRALTSLFADITAAMRAVAKRESGDAPR